MKILYVNMSLDPIMGGGTAERTFQLARHMVLMGNECTVLTTETGMTPERLCSLKSCKIVALPVFSKRFLIPKTRRREITKLVAMNDIVHIMNHWNLLNALAYRAARRLNKPYAVCPAGALPIFGRSRLLKKGFNALIGYDIIRHAQAHIAIASNEMAQFASYGIASDQITIIPNGVNPQEYQLADATRFRRRTGLGTAPYILFVGRLNLIKGPDLLLKAFIKIAHLHHTLHLVFAGPDGGMEALLKVRAGKESIHDQVHFVGYIEGADKAAAYQGASFVVVPSRQEAMSIVVLEAGICGKAVLMTDQCGFSTTDPMDGVQVVAPTVAGIREGLLKMLQDDTNTKEMGERFRHYVTENYTWDIAALRYQALFNQVLLDRRTMAMNAT